MNTWLGPSEGAATRAEDPGVVYRVHRAEMIRYMNLAAIDKLRWLQRANSMLRALPPDVRDLHERFKGTAP